MYQDLTYLRFLDKLKGSDKITDKDRVQLIQTHYKKHIDHDKHYETASKLSDYFSDYTLFTDACKLVSIPNDICQRFEDKINRENLIIMIFNIKKYTDEFEVEKEYMFENTINGTYYKTKIINRGNRLFSIKVQHEGKGSSGSYSMSGLNTLRGLIIDEHFFSRIK